jgi:hypothetical protein
MNHTNANHLTVNIGGNWRLYTNTIPKNSTPLGTVTRNGRDTGALVRIEATGIYVQVNAGVVRYLDTRKVVASLAAAGRSPKMLAH